jgi:hypothetical protein
MERFMNDSRTLTSSFKDHLYNVDNGNVKNIAAICPEAEVQSMKYNQYFNGSEMVVKTAEHTSRQSILTANPERYYTSDTTLFNDSFYTEG